MSEKPDIFISYRRAGGVHTAKEIALELRARGYAVFFDGKSISSGRFWDTIRASVEACSDFLLVLTPGALDRCADGTEHDFVAREIALAMKLGKNIVPVMTDGFAFPNPMPECIRGIEEYNAGDAVSADRPQAIEQMLDFKIKHGFFKSVPQNATGANAADTAGVSATAQETVVIVPPEKRGNGFPWIALTLVGVAAAAGFGVRQMQSEEGELVISEEIESAPPSAPQGKMPVPAAKTDSAEPPAPVRPEFHVFPSQEITDFAESKCFTSLSKLKKWSDDFFENEIRMLDIRKTYAGVSGREDEWKTSEKYSELAAENAEIRAQANRARDEIINAYLDGNAKPSSYTTEHGDTLNRIAKKLECSAADLRAANPGVDFTRLRIGVELNIPKKKK